MTHPPLRAICVFDAPSAARNTIRARIACCCDADGVLKHRPQLGFLLLRQLDRRCAPRHTTTVREVPYIYKLLKARCTSLLPFTQEIAGSSPASSIDEVFTFDLC